LLGWSLLFSNLFALPLMNIGGLLLEGAPNKDFTGVVGAVAVSYLLVPFQAYAALKGLLEKEEGPWFRTPKTGKITDPVTHLRRLYKLRKWLFGNGHGNGGGRRLAPVLAIGVARPPRRPSRKVGWIVTLAVVCALGGLGVEAVNAPIAEAAGTSLYLHGGSCPTTDGTMDTTSPTSTTKTWSLGTAAQSCQWDASTSTTSDQTIYATDVFTFTFWAVSSKANRSAAISATFGYSAVSTCNSVTAIATMPTFSFTLASTSSTQETPPTFSPAADVLVPAGSFFCWTITVQTASGNISLQWDSSAAATNLNSSDTIFVPEYVLLLAGIAFILPVARRNRRRSTPLSRSGSRESFDWFELENAASADVEPGGRTAGDKPADAAPSRP
jgi:hypothetical protein